MSRPVPPTEADEVTTLGGLVEHHALVEADWFAGKLRGEPPAERWESADWDADADGDWEWTSAARDTASSCTPSGGTRWRGRAGSSPAGSTVDPDRAIVTRQRASEPGSAGPDVLAATSSSAPPARLGCPPSADLIE